MEKKMRTVISVDKELCIGCGKCVLKCPGGALAIIDGKAQVVSESFCDGLGKCLGRCPTGALTLSQREVDEYDAGGARENKRAALQKRVGGGTVQEEASTPHEGHGHHECCGGKDKHHKHADGSECCGGKDKHHKHADGSECCGGQDNHHHDKHHEKHHDKHHEGHGHHKHADGSECCGGKDKHHKHADGSECCGGKDKHHKHADGSECCGGKDNHHHDKHHEKHHDKHHEGHGHHECCGGKDKHHKHADGSECCGGQDNHHHEKHHDKHHHKHADGSECCGGKDKHHKHADGSECCGGQGQVAAAMFQQPMGLRPGLAAAMPGKRPAFNRWPVKIRLASPESSWLQGAAVLVAADCAMAVAPWLHERQKQGEVLLIGCPKLEGKDALREALTEQFRTAGPCSVAVVRMEVPCCQALVHACTEALEDSGIAVQADILEVVAIPEWEKE